MKTKQHLFECAADNKKVPGPVYLNMRKKYCKYHYLKLFNNPDTKTIQEAYAQ